MKYIDLQNIKSVREEFVWKKNDDFYYLKYIPFSEALNIIIGPNNSRKSRFLRTLMSQDRFIISEQIISSITQDIIKLIEKIIDENNFQTLETRNKSLTIDRLRRRKPDEIKFKSVIEYFERSGKALNQNLTRTSLGKLATQIQECWQSNTVKEFNAVLIAADRIINLLELAKDYSTFSEDNYQMHSAFSLIYNGGVVIKNNEVDPTILQLSNKLKKLTKINPQFLKAKFTYIPTLRGSVNLILKNDEGQLIDTSNIYEQTLRENYKIPEAVNIFTGLDLYKRIKTARNSPRSIRKNFEAFETFISKAFFDGNLIDIIALEEKKAIQIFLEETNEDRKMYDLGDGIQSIINLMYPVFTADAGEWVIIEEPEISLHPKLQTLFLNTLLFNTHIKDKKLNIFISTHSNFLLDHLLITNQKVAATRFYKDTELFDNQTIAESVIENDLSALDDLGVTNSSVFMSNCTIWAEGITDRLYIKSFLDAYIQENQLPPLKENYDYSFIEYAGSNLKHYIFDAEIKESKSIISRFISNRIFLIADTDENKIEKHKKLHSLETKHFKYQETGAIEIENILSSNAVKHILRNLGVNETSLSRMKIEEEDFEEVRMGTYLDKKIKGKLSKHPKLKANSGTLEDRYKKRFAELISDNVTSKELSWSDLSTNKHCRELTQKLYKYITQQKINAA